MNDQLLDEIEELPATCTLCGAKLGADGRCPEEEDPDDDTTEDGIFDDDLFGAP